jgi:acyl-CoA synthetase (NDP forming)
MLNKTSVHLSMMDTSALLSPRSIAVIGASNDPNKIGGRPIAFMKRAAYLGRIVPINPSGTSIQGLQAYSHIADAGDPIDHAIIALAAPLVEDAFSSCVEHGVRAVTIFSAGFSEANEAGREVQDRIAQRAKDHGIALLGPNSLGLFNVKTGFFGTFATALDGAWPRAGNVGIATQSGALGSYCFALAEKRGLGISTFIATGNESGIDVATAIELLARDADTAIILAALEGARDGRRLIDAMRLAHDKGKAVIVMKTGATAAGAGAAASHTGSLAGSDAVFDAAFRRAGAYRAQTMEEMVEVAYLASKIGTPRSRSVGIITTSGGVGVAMADAAERVGLSVPRLPESVQSAVKEILPLASGTNPVDTTASIIGDPNLLVRMLAAMLKGTDIELVVCFIAHVGRNPSHFNPVVDGLARLQCEFPDRRFIVSSLTTPQTKEILENRGFPVFEEPATALRALGACVALGQTLPAPENTDQFAMALPSLDHADINEVQAKALLSQLGIESPAEGIAKTADEACSLATRIGFPVVLKIVSPDIMHKTDIGGVALNVTSEAEVASAFQRIFASARKHVPGARLDGCLVSAQFTGGVETIIGTTIDATFGPVIMFGIGGTTAELFKDITFRLAPVTPEEAREMVLEVKCAPLLTGWRGSKPLSIDRLAAAVSRVSRLAAQSSGHIASIEINPLLVHEHGITALDALVTPVLAPDVRYERTNG